MLHPARRRADAEFQSGKNTKPFGIQNSSIRHSLSRRRNGQPRSPAQARDFPFWNAHQFRQCGLGAFCDTASLDGYAGDLVACGIAAQKGSPSRRHIIAEWRYAAPTSNDNVLVRVHSAKLAPLHGGWKRQILRRDEPLRSDLSGNAACV